MKTKQTLDLEYRALYHTRHRREFGCQEVTIGWYGKERVDFLSVDQHGAWRFFEIKVTKADFNSKAKKTFLGNYGYYIMPESLYRFVKHDIPDEIGVLVPCGKCELKSIKKATRTETKVPRDELYLYLLRSMFYRTYNSVAEDIAIKIESKGRSMQELFDMPEEEL